MGHRLPAEEHGLELTRCVVVGDKPSDVGVARNAGCGAVLVRTGWGGGSPDGARLEPAVAGPGSVPDFTAAGVLEGVLWILARRALRPSAP